MPGSVVRGTALATGLRGSRPSHRSGSLRWPDFLAPDQSNRLASSRFLPLEGRTYAGVADQAVRSAATSQWPTRVVTKAGDSNFEAGSSTDHPVDRGTSGS